MIMSIEILTQKREFVYKKELVNLKPIYMPH